MPIMGYYDGTAVRVNEQLQMNQRVIVIPIENEESLADTAAGGLHKYANAVLRFLLQDFAEQFQQVRNVVKRDNCYGH